MATSTKYTNYILGSVRQISECKSIVLYGKSKYSTRISLYNLESFYLENLQGSDTAIHARLTRDSISEDFKYTKNLNNGFDVIVYISDSTNLPIGYTEFNNLQGIGIFMDISVDLDRTTEQEEADELILDFTISDKSSLGKSMADYVKTGDLMSKVWRNQYTTSTSRTETDPKSAAFLRSSVVKRAGTWNLGIARNVQADPYEVGFTKHDVCFYRGDIVLVSWNDEKYGVISLLRKNAYSLPYTYVAPGTNLVEPIERLGGRYFYSVTGNLFELVTQETYKETRGETTVADPRNPEGMVYEFPIFYSKTEVLKYIPEINNTYLDLDKYFESYQMIIQRKIGSWFILQQKYSGSVLYVAVSPVSILYMGPDDLERAMFVSDQTVILSETGHYAIFCNPGETMYTERARMVVEGGRIVENYDGTGITMCVLDNPEIDEAHYLDYYTGKVPVVFSYEDLRRTELNNYRRGPLPSTSEVPEIVCSFSGLLFYKEGTIINYL